MVEICATVLRGDDPAWVKTEVRTRCRDTYRYWKFSDILYDILRVLSGQENIVKELNFALTLFISTHSILSCIGVDRFSHGFEVSIIFEDADHVASLTTGVAIKTSIGAVNYLLLAQIYSLIESSIPLEQQRFDIRCRRECVTWTTWSLIFDWSDYIVHPPVQLFG